MATIATRKDTHTEQAVGAEGDPHAQVFLEIVIRTALRWVRESGQQEQFLERVRERDNGNR